MFYATYMWLYLAILVTNKNFPRCLEHVFLKQSLEQMSTWTRHRNKENIALALGRWCCLMCLWIRTQYLHHFNGSALSSALYFWRLIRWIQRRVAGNIFTSSPHISCHFLECDICLWYIFKLQRKHSFLLIFKVSRKAIFWNGIRSELQSWEEQNGTYLISRH